MQRADYIKQIQSQKQWDVVVIGGGATGLGIALDATTRGYSTLLLEAADFAKGTSSRSTKLVHGGVRYLAQGDIGLVKEALRERGRLAKNAPHLFKRQAFIIPGEHAFSAPYYTIGLWLYDFLAGKLSIGRTKYLSKNVARKQLKDIKEDKVNAGVCYYDGQFDDARLATTLLQTIMDYHGAIINYCPVNSLLKDEQGKVCGVECQDLMQSQSYKIKAKTVINATGVFANDILAMDESITEPKIIPSQGIHLVIDKEFLSGDNALMVPKTSDGRVLFAVPWHNKLVVGTTDTLVDTIDYEPKPIEEEIEFILETTKQYFKRPVTKADVKSVFVGLRPLAAPEKQGQSTKKVSRSHKVEVAKSNLIHIFGGKWTTYRQMAEDTIDQAIDAGLLPQKTCQTANLQLHGYVQSAKFDTSPLAPYGSDAKEIQQLIDTNPKLAELIHPDYPYTFAQVKWAIDHEMAQTLEDVLARRIRLLFLDAKATGAAAEKVAEFMQTQLGWDDQRLQLEIQAFAKLVEQYSLSSK